MMCTYLSVSCTESDLYGQYIMPHEVKDIIKKQIQATMYLDPTVFRPVKTQKTKN